MVIKNKTKTKRGKKIFRRASETYWWEQAGWGGGGGGGRRGGGGVAWGGVRDEVWDRETMFSQLTKWSPRVVVSGKLEYFSHSNYF